MPRIDWQCGRRWLVERHVRRGTRLRRDARLHRVQQCARQLLRHHRAAVAESAHRQALRPRFSTHHHSRHGRRTVPFVAVVWHRENPARRRRVAWRNAGARMGRDVPRHGGIAPADGHLGPTLGVVHRAKRGAATGHRRRRRVARRLVRPRSAAAQRTCRRANDGDVLLSLLRELPAALWPPATRERPVRGGKLSASPGRKTGRALRRQHLHHPHESDGHARSRSWPRVIRSRARGADNAGRDSLHRLGRALSQRGAGGTRPPHPRLAPAFSRRTLRPRRISD